MIMLVMVNMLWTMDNGQWTMDNGQWTMDNGQWTMDNGQWTIRAKIREWGFVAMSLGGNLDKISPR